MRIIRAQLEGPDAELGRVAASDVARMIIGLERAIARAAYLVLGQERRGTGRHRQAQSFADLQASQGTTGRVDPADLAIEDLTDDERAAFLAALDA